jgi:hypothetical protein
MSLHALLTRIKAEINASGRKQKDLFVRVDVKVVRQSQSIRLTRKASVLQLDYVIY